MPHKVIRSIGPQPCRKCGSYELAVHYKGHTWIVTNIICGKCGHQPTKYEDKWEVPA